MLTLTFIKKTPPDSDKISSKLDDNVRVDNLDVETPEFISPIIIVHKPKKELLKNEIQMCMNVKKSQQSPLYFEKYMSSKNSFSEKQTINESKNLRFRNFIIF